MNHASQAMSTHNDKPQSVGILLLDNFTLISLACAIEPLRMANHLSGTELYCWRTLSIDGAQVVASDGILITPDTGAYDISTLNMVIVCGGVSIQRSFSQQHLTWLQAQARQSTRLGAVCTGSWVLACAGLLDGYSCSVHWECLATMKKTFPEAIVTTRLFSVDRSRFTCSGGTAPLDMMLNIISKEHGKELASGISKMFVYDRVRNEQDDQRVPLKHLFGDTQLKLQEIVSLMEANLEELIELDDLAAYAQVSRRQLERMFLKYLHCSPSRYYLKLRLIFARQLLKQTTTSIEQIASKCAFFSTPHFSKCYREYYGLAPREERSLLML